MRGTRVIATVLRREEEMHMMIQRLTCLAAVGVASTAMAGNFTFDAGGDGTSWDDAENWAPDGVPGIGDSVTIGVSQVSTFTVSVSAPVEVAALDVLNGSNLHFFNDATITATEAASFFGDLLGGDDAFVDCFGEGTIVVDGVGTFNSLSLGDQTDLVVNGSMSAISDDDSWAQILGTTEADVVIHGSLMLQGGSSGNNRISSGTVTIAPGGSMHVTSGGWDVSSVTPHSVSLGGAVSVDMASDSRFVVAGLVAADGDVHVMSGTMEIGGTPLAEIGGLVTVDEFATLHCSGGNTSTMRFTGQLTGAGRLLAGARVVFDDLDATIATVEQGDGLGRALVFAGASTLTGDLTTNGEICGSGELTALGATDLGPGTGLGEQASLVLGGPAVIDNLVITTDASLTLEADAMVVGNIGDGGSQGGALIIAPGVTVTMNGPTFLAVGAESENLGTMLKIGPETLVIADAHFTGFANHGLISVLEGTLISASTAPQSGEFHVAAGATLESNRGTFTETSAWTGEGLVRIVSGGSLIMHHGRISVPTAEFLASVGGSGTFTFQTLTIGVAALRQDVLVITDELILTANCEVKDNAHLQVLGNCVQEVSVGLSASGRLEIFGTWDWMDGALGGPATGQGRVVVAAGGTLNCLVLGDPKSPFDLKSPFDNDGRMALDHGGLLRFRAALASTNNGTIECLSGESRYQDGPLIQGPSGSLRLNGGVMTVASPWPNLRVDAGLIAGTGTFTDKILAPSATISPGNSPGELVFDAGLSLGTSAACVIEIAGTDTGSFDRLTVNGVAEIDGVLIIGYLDGYEPPIGSVFTVLTADSVVGAFTDVAGPGVYDVTYTGTEVIVAVVDPDLRCPGDADGDGDTGFPDLLSILAAWGPCGESCPQDLDRDGNVGFPDLLVVLASWGPCPENVVYDVTLSSPLHTVGVPPTTGGGPPVRETVSAMVYNLPVVVPSLGPLVDQPLQFSWGEGEGTYAFFVVHDLPSAPRWWIEFDVVIEEESFGTSTFRASVPTGGTGGAFLRFSNGLLVVGPGIDPVVVEYELGTPLRVRIEMDFDKGTRRYLLDDVLILEHSTLPGGVMGSLVFNGSSPLRSGGTGGLAAIDNVRITNSD